MTRRSGDGDLPSNMGVATLVRVTAAAILVRIGQRELWVPQSVVHDDSEVFGKGTKGELQEPGVTGKLIVKTWWALKGRHS